MLSCSHERTKNNDVLLSFPIFVPPLGRRERGGKRRGRGEGRGGAGGGGGGEGEGKEKGRPATYTGRRTEKIRYAYLPFRRSAHWRACLRMRRDV